MSYQIFSMSHALCPTTVDRFISISAAIGATLGEVRAFAPPDDAVRGLDATKETEIAGQCSGGILGEEEDDRVNLRDPQVVAPASRPGLVQHGVGVLAGPRADGAGAAANAGEACAEEAGGYARQETATIRTVRCLSGH